MLKPWTVSSVNSKLTYLDQLTNSVNQYHTAPLSSIACWKFRRFTSALLLLLLSYVETMRKHTISPKYYLTISHPHISPIHYLNITLSHLHISPHISSPTYWLAIAHPNTISPLLTHIIYRHTSAHPYTGST